MNIYERISKVMQEVEYLAKDDSVSTGGSGSYKAISEEKVTSTIRKSLINNGIVIIPIKQEHRREDEQVKDKYDNIKISRLTTVDVTYKIQNIEDKEDYIEAVSSGTGVDTQDKGIGKAMTYAYKYLLLRTFAIPTGEDPDKISSDVYSEEYTKTQKIGKQVNDKQDVADILDEGTGLEKISQIQEQALRDFIKNNNIATDFVTNTLKDMGYTALKYIQIKDYMKFHDILEKATKE